MKVIYFGDCHGRAEPIRMLLNYHGVDFEDIRLTYEEFTEHKSQGTFEFGFAPAIQIDEETYC